MAGAPIARPAAAGNAWWAPDVALAVACVTLFYSLFVFRGYQKLFRDSDAGWHIVTGERILATGELPRTDTYSFTRAGQPWFAWEWASDVLMGAIHRGAGLPGVALFYAAVIAASVWLWFRLHWTVQGDFLFACAMAPLLLSTCNIHWLARPHVISWLFILGTVLYVERMWGRLPACPRFRLRDAAAVALFAALWANVHASFFSAPVRCLIYAVRPVGNPVGRGPVRRPSRRWFLMAAVISSLAPLANPYGWRLYSHVFRYVTDSALLSRIGEFQSFDFHAAGSEQIIAALFLGMMGGTLALTRGRVEHFLLAVLVTWLALRSARALPLAALLLLPIANAAITGSLREGFCLRHYFAYTARLRAMDARLSGVALAPLVILCCWMVLRAPALAAVTGFPPDQFPVAAWPQVAHLPAGARVFAPDKFGGYLIYRSGGAFKVFFDGRSDLYGADFLKQYGRLAQARPGWQTWWSTFHFTHALLPNDAPLLPALEQAGWKPIYHDHTVTLLAGGGT